MVGDAGQRGNKEPRAKKRPENDFTFDSSRSVTLEKLLNTLRAQLRISWAYFEDKLKAHSTSGTCTVRLSEWV